MVCKMSGVCGRFFSENTVMYSVYVNGLVIGYVGS